MAGGRRLAFGGIVPLPAGDGVVHSGSCPYRKGLDKWSPKTL
nr:MAG TPA: hypothetical protein [Caudoviricetes sp.]